eukprot:Skav203449  [mRNA]  locus=scaffold818:34416:40662:+ [translate_table: standard]
MFHFFSPGTSVPPRIHGPIKATPEFDAGGLRVKVGNVFTAPAMALPVTCIAQERSFAGAEYVGRPSDHGHPPWVSPSALRGAGLGHRAAPGLQMDQREPGGSDGVDGGWWVVRSWFLGAGLCGGSYYRTEAVLDAFSDESSDGSVSGWWLKLDIIRERKKAEELALEAPRAVAGFYRGALKLGSGTVNALPETEKFRVNALFVQFYGGGERAWSLGEAYAPEALQAEEEERREKRRKTGEEVSESDSEDMEELLGRFSNVQQACHRCPSPGGPTALHRRPGEALVVVVP